ncbi:MAG: amino acid racemase [Lachnospiraceae bacterium]|nr:amino acid racemase [Lachnospiraceae bacterium]
MSQEGKMLGVIGGLGPQATSYFYNDVIEHTKASRDQEHIDMVILSHATTPDRTRAILSGDDKALIASLTRDVKILEDLGAANIAIPCNTSHYYYDVMQSVTDVPIINMVRESVLAAIKKYGNVRKIGIMGTDGTISTGIYKKECDKLEVEAVTPSPDRQKDVMRIIYDEIKAGERGSKSLFNRVVDELIDDGCDAIILACTELSVYKKFHTVHDICLDAMDVLVKESILRSGRRYQ